MGETAPRAIPKFIGLLVSYYSLVTLGRVEPDTVPAIDTLTGQGQRTPTCIRGCEKCEQSVGDGGMEGGEDLPGEAPER